MLDIFSQDPSVRTGISMSYGKSKGVAAYKQFSSRHASYYIFDGIDLSPKKERKKNNNLETDTFPIFLTLPL